MSESLRRKTSFGTRAEFRTVGIHTTPYNFAPIGIGNVPMRSPCTMTLALIRFMTGGLAVQNITWQISSLTKRFTTTRDRQQPESNASRYQPSGFSSFCITDV
jgi:hypothetical protein